MEYESYVSLETAKLLKQAGFDWDYVKAYFTGWGDNFEYGTLITIGGERGSVIPEDALTPAPTLDVAQRWLREVKEVDVIVTYESVVNEKTSVYEKKYAVVIYDAFINEDTDYHDTYEEALEAGIKKCLEEDCITDKCSEE